MHHYVYIVEDVETEEFYIGSRTSKVLPNNDNYYGSMKGWKVDKRKLFKTILQTFESRNDAFMFEIELIKKSINHPLNRNYFIPSIGFHTHGMKRSIKWKTWNSNRLKGVKNPNYGKDHGLCDDIVKRRIGLIKNIDLSKFGWVKMVSKKLGLTHTQTKRFIKKYVTCDFYVRKSPT